jgi:hypothetical protein
MSATPSRRAWGMNRAIFSPWIFPIRPAPITPKRNCSAIELLLFTGFLPGVLSIPETLSKESKFFLIYSCKRYHNHSLYKKICKVKKIQNLKNFSGGPKRLFGDRKGPAFPDIKKKKQGGFYAQIPAEKYFRSLG